MTGSSDKAKSCRSFKGRINIFFKPSSVLLQYIFMSKSAKSLAHSRIGFINIIGVAVVHLFLLGRGGRVGNATCSFRLERKRRESKEREGERVRRKMEGAVEFLSAVL